MNRVAIAAAFAAVAAGWLVVGSAEPAHAMVQFKNAFAAKYVKADSGDAQDQAFAAEVEKVKCNVCHTGNSKKMRNAYGAAIDQFIEKTDKDPAKIAEALNKAADVKSDPNDPNSLTFGQLLEQGKLPGSK